MSYSLAFTQALAATIYLADRVQQHASAFTPTTQLAQDLNIPRPSAVKILQSLSQAGIVETREGAKGGVRLARSAEDVTVLDIFTAIEGERPLFHKELKFNVQGRKPRQAQRVISTILGDAEVAMKSDLQATTIAGLLATISTR